MDAHARVRRAVPADEVRSTAAKGRSHRREAAGVGEHGRQFVSLVRKLERNWPLSVAAILLAFMVLSFLRPT